MVSTNRNGGLPNDKRPVNMKLKNTGAKVLSERLAKLFNFFTRKLTTCKNKAREHIAKSGEIRRRTILRKQEVQGNYPKFKQKFAEKKNYHLKSQLKTAAVWQMPSQSSKMPKVDI